MSDLMLYGVLRMPYDMAMGDELSRRQFYGRVQGAADRLQAAEAKLAEQSPPCGESIDSPEFQGLLWQFLRTSGNKFALEAIIAHIDAKLTAARRLPDGYVLVPVEPTEDMVTCGFESWPDRFFSKPDVWAAYEAMTGCQQAAYRAKLCYEAMISASPSPDKG